MAADSERLAAAALLCADLQRFDTPTVSNAIETFGVRPNTAGYASSRIACQFPDLPPMVGFAVTCTRDSTTPRGTRATRLGELLDALEACPKPAVLVSQYVGPEIDRGCALGDMIARLYGRLGAVGMATDAPIRDLAGIRQSSPGFQVFTPGSVASHGDSLVVEVGVPVTIGGLMVRPGDLVHGDANGLLVVPAEIAAEVPDRALKMQADEAEVMALLAQDPLDIDEIRRRFGQSPAKRRERSDQ